MTAMRARRRGTKRLDLSTLREALKDSRVWASMGVVVKPDGEESATHWEIVVDDDGNATDIVVEVNLVPANIEVTARLNMLGAVQVPEVGDEVLVVFPDGQLDWMPSIVGRMSGGHVPYPSSALIHDTRPKPGTILIVPPAGGHVYVYDGDTGTVDNLVRKSEYNALKNKYDNHKRAGALGGTGSAPALTTAPVTDPAGTTGDPLPSITGTTVLLAK